MSQPKTNIKSLIEAVELTHKAEPSEKLMQQLYAIPDQLAIRQFYVSKRLIWSVAAGLLLLISINTLTLQKHSNSQSNKSNVYFSHLAHI